MKIKLIESSPTPQSTNRLSEFEIGSIGIIRSWGSDKSYVGVIVKRTEEDLLPSLEYLISTEYPRKGHYWTNFMDVAKMKGDFYIETLTPGTKLEITL